MSMRSLNILVVSLTLNFSLFASENPRPLKINPEEMAKAEVTIWKDYYNHDYISILPDISKMISLQYDISQRELLFNLTPKLGLAVMRFKNMPSKTTDEEYYQEVLPSLTAAYETLKNMINAKWDPALVAKEDLKWWILRRHGQTGDPEIVGEEMGKLFKTLFGENDGHHFVRAAYLRASAARYRDLCKMEWSGVLDKDWDIIFSILKLSYAELAKGIDANAKSN